MNKINRTLRNSEGITIVELLATLVIVSIIGALSYSILSQGYANYQRIQVETQLRDEADLIMASLLKDLFVLKESEIASVENCNDSVKSSYLNVTKQGTLPSSSYKTGFEGSKVYVKGNEVKFYDENVQILPTTCSSTSPTFIKKTPNKGEYTIAFTLQIIKGNKPHKMKFINTIQVIDDSKEVAG